MLGVHLVKHGHREIVHGLPGRDRLTMFAIGS
jgi:hypothetical protein